MNKIALLDLDVEPESFPCDSCGLCCKLVSTSQLLSSLDRGDGTCMFFNDLKSNCSIYDKRPTICRVESMYEFYKPRLTKIQYFNLNIRVCNELKEQFLILNSKESI